MSDRICRWGIMGTAGIARKNWHSILNAGNAQLVAVASRDQQRSLKFIDECQAQIPHPEPPAALGSYAAMLERDDIDAVYIPLPTGVRKEWVIRSAEAGKHVLAEKPCGLSVEDVQAMVDACHANQVQYMDGVMFMHNDRLAQMRRSLDAGDIGKLRRISTNFSFLAPEEFLADNIRVKSNLEPLGCLGDLGWYTARVVLWAMNYELPERVCGRLLSYTHAEGSENPTPTEFSAELFFKDGVSANFYCAFVAQHQQWVRFSGTKGYMAVEDFVLPRFGNELEFTVCNNAFTLDNCVFTMEEYATRHGVAEFANNHPTAQETKLFRNFSDIVLSGELDSTWGDMAVKTQRVVDACYASACSDGRMISL